MRTDILEREREIRKWVHDGESKAFMCDKLRCKHETLNKYLYLLGIEYGGNQGRKGKSGSIRNGYIPLMKYLDMGGRCRGAIKEKMFREGYKEYKCEICGASEWLGKYLPLELHHKNGDSSDNEYDNLQILCPNCHSIQGGNSGSNMGRYTFREYTEEYKREAVMKAQRDIIKRKQMAEEAKLRREERLSKQQADIERRKNLIMNSGIDFSKFGWVVKVSEIPGIGIQRHKITKWMRKHMPEFLDNCYVYNRDRPHTYDSNEK